MDVRSDNTAATPSKGFDYEAAFASLENLVSRTQSCVHVVNEFLGNLEIRTVERDCIKVSVSELRAILFMSEEAFNAADDLENLWLEHHNNSVDLQREIDLARGAS